MSDQLRSLFFFPCVSLLLHAGNGTLDVVLITVTPVICWPASVGSRGALSQNMLSSAALWNCLVQLSACADLCFCLFPLPREVKEPCNRFICTINKNFQGLKRQKERKGTREKRPLIRWSMRCFYLTSKASRGVQPESWLSLVALSVVEAKHVMCLSSYLNASPAVSNKSSKQFYFLQVWPNMSMAIFPPILCILPSFPRPSQYSFLLVALLCS